MKHAHQKEREREIASKHLFHAAAFITLKYYDVGWKCSKPFFRSLSLHTKRKKLVVCVCVEKVPLKQRFQPSHDAKCNLSIFVFLFAGNIIQHQPLCIHYVSILSVCVCVNSFFLFVITFLLLFLRQHHHCHNHHHRNHLF